MLEAVEIEQTEPFLLVAPQLFQPGLCRAPFLIDLADLTHLGEGAGEGVEHFKLRLRGEETLLLVLAVDIAKGLGEVTQGCQRHNTTVDVGPGFTAFENFSFDNQFGVFDLDGRIG